MNSHLTWNRQHWPMNWRPSGTKKSNAILINRVFFEPPYAQWNGGRCSSVYCSYQKWKRPAIFPSPAHFLFFQKELLNIIQPILLAFLMDFFEPCSTMSSEMAWLLALGTVLTAFGSSILFNYVSSLREPLETDQTMCSYSPTIGSLFTLYKCVLLTKAWYFAK